MTPEQLREMTGQDSYTSTPRLVLNEVLLNGDGDIEEVDGKIVHKGGYFRKRLWVGKADDGKPEDINLGKEVSLVFLKIRRKLVQRSTEGKITRSTGEHDTVDDIVSVYEEGNKVFTGSGREARTQYDGLRTVQVVYALLLTGTTEPELVRLTVKGASLGSESRPKELPSFYQYLGSFGSDLFLNYKTNLGVYLEQGKKKYYTMTFTKGDAVAEANRPLVIEKLTLVHEQTKDKKAVVEAALEPAIEYPEEEFNPADIGF